MINLHDNYLDDLVNNLKIRAESITQVAIRKYVSENQPKEISKLLEEAAETIQELKKWKEHYEDIEMQAKCPCGCEG